MKRRKGTSERNAAPPRISLHAARRLRQRGLREGDLDRVRASGEEFSEGYLLSKRAIGEKVAELKGEIQRLERLRDVVLIEQDDTFVTVYRANHRRCRRILNGGATRRHMYEGGATQ